MSRIPEKWDNVFDADGDLSLIKTDLLILMLKKAAEENSTLITENQKQYQIWELATYPKMVSLVFDLCTALKIDDNFVKYNSCELYEEFLHRHIINLREEISSGEHEGEESAIWDNIRRQSLLRLVTCIILSTKISSYQSLKALDDYCDLIKQFGQNFSKRAFTKSEIRVLQTVEYKVDRCPLYTLCPLLILTLIHNEPSIDGHLLFSIIFKIMDFFYLTKSDILSQLYEILKTTKKISQSDFKKMTNDTMLFSCAMIAAIPIIMDKDNGSKILKELAYITCYDMKDIETVRDLLAKKIISSQ